jgi:hypothetical protein
MTSPELVERVALLVADAIAASGQGNGNAAQEGAEAIIATIEATHLEEVVRLVEPLLRFHETGGHEGDGSDERLAQIRAALTLFEVRRS